MPKTEFEKSLKVREEVLPKDDVDIARSVAGLARVSPAHEASALFERARAICSRSFDRIVTKSLGQTRTSLDKRLRASSFKRHDRKLSLL